MFFTIGNLITLGIVILALVLYRYLDKNNRSLEKIRKYAEKCMNDIAAYTEEKGAAVKDFGIALDVERKAAAELMRHIHTLTEEELAQKAQAIAQIDERIRAYDSSMEELVKMTGRVQENLNRIRDESAFVESTGKRIGEAKEKLDHIEKALGGTEKKLNEVELRFERENAGALEKASAELVAAVQTRVSGFEASAETIEHKIEAHREAVHKVERERETRLAHDIDTINKTLREAVERAGSRADKMEDAALVKLRDQAQERLGQFKAVWEEKIKAAQETVKTRLGDIQEQLKSTKEEWKTESAAIEARQKAYRDEWKKDVQELNALARQQKENAGAALTGQRKEWEKNIQELSALAKQQGGELSAALTGQRKEWEKNIQELSALAKQQGGELSAAIGKQKEELTLLSRNTEQSVIAALETRLAEYNQVQAEEFKQ
jgi:chromosome segregation ATPase